MIIQGNPILKSTGADLGSILQFFKLNVPLLALSKAKKLNIAGAEYFRSHFGFFDLERRIKSSQSKIDIQYFEKYYH